jgi:hypothetical protein
MCKVLLRNDWWCKGLGQTQPKSDAYEKYKEIKRNRKAKLLAESTVRHTEQADDSDVIDRNEGLCCNKDSQPAITQGVAASSDVGVDAGVRRRRLLF